MAPRPRTRAGTRRRPRALARLLAAGAVAVAGHPSLWPAGSRQLLRLGRQRGRFALPSGAYLGWRLETAYGAREGTPTIDELAAWLAWCKRLDRAAR